MDQHVKDFISGKYQKPEGGALRRRVYEVIFESDTAAGKAFDVILIIAIVLSVGVVLADSVPSLHTAYKSDFLVMEWGFTILFSIEYLLRLWSVKRHKAYALSLYGIVDILAILPTYLSLVESGAQYLLVVRSLRLLRVFRIFKMTLYMSEGSLILQALYKSYRKISVFILFIIVLVTIVGSVMYVVEGPEYGYHSIPDSIYWAIVTLTTVGYGDMAPGTPLGKFLACIVMLCGYAIIAVPTGIVTSEFTRLWHHGKVRNCSGCHRQLPDESAFFCQYCGTKLEEVSEQNT